MEEWYGKGIEFLRQNKWIAVVLVLGALLFLTGRIISFMSEEEKVEIIATNEMSNSSKISIWVDVEGAVVNPGVYELKEGARVKDALLSAGGLNEKADRNRIARSVNLAAVVTDGAKIYIVSEGEAEVVMTGSVSGVNTSRGGMVNINTASANDLDKLWGIGAARAQQIIDGRPYASIEELKSKGNVPENVFERIKGMIEI